MFPLISFPYVSRILDPAGIGSVSFIDSFTWYFVTLAEFGIATYGIREIARSRESRSELAQTVSGIVLLHCITTAFVLVIYGTAVAAVWYRVHDVRLVLLSFSFLLLNAFSSEWYFIGLERFRFIAIRNMITRLLGLLSIFLLIQRRDDYYIYYAIITSTATLTLLWNFVVLSREIKISLARAHWKQHLKESWPIFQIAILFAASIWLDNVLLGLFSTIAALGYYALAIKLIRMSGAVITDTLLVLYPRMVALLHQNRHEQAQTTNLQSIRLITLLIVPVCAGVFLVAKPFTQVYLGAQFDRVHVDIEILSLYPLIKSYSLYLNRQVLLPMQKDKSVIRGLFAGVVTMIALMVALCPSMQDIGACIAILVSETVTIFFFIYALRKEKASAPLVDGTILIQAVLTSLLFIPIVYGVNQLDIPALQQLIITVVACTLIYFGFQFTVFRNKLLKELYQYTLVLMRAK